MRLGPLAPIVTNDLYALRYILSAFAAVALSPWDAYPVDPGTQRGQPAFRPRSGHVAPAAPDQSRVAFIALSGRPAEAAVGCLVG